MIEKYKRREKLARNKNSDWVIKRNIQTHLCGNQGGDKAYSVGNGMAIIQVLWQ